MNTNLNGNSLMPVSYCGIHVIDYNLKFLWQNNITVVTVAFILFQEQATDGDLASENWSLNMEICDLVNETEDGPRDAIKAIRKRLTQNAGKNYTIVMYTLTVLETCVKNCGKRFHILVCNKDFIQELVNCYNYVHI